MTTTAPPKSIPKHQPNSDEPGARRPVARTRPPAPEPTSTTRQGRGPTILFQVPFASAMSDPDIALLVRTLGLTAHLHPKLRGSPASPGAVRLDHYSGLFLERGAMEDQWVLEARTWGQPAPESVHEWQVLAAGAARLLDPVVTFPERRTAASPGYPIRPVGRAANKRLAGFRRRITGLR